MRYSQIAVRSTISFCLVSVLGFTILLNAAQNSIAMPFQESYRFAGSWGAQGNKDGQSSSMIGKSLIVTISTDARQIAKNLLIH